jgi:hypothetical protein
MPQGQLNKLTNLSHLLPAATDIVVANLVKVALLVLTLYRLTFAVDDGILGNDAELRRVHLNNLELNLPHTTASCEGIALANRPVGFPEIRSKEYVE